MDKWTVETNEELKADAIIRRLCDSGWDAYIAGGAARDILSGRKPVDYDVVTNASFKDIKRLFSGKKTSVVGVSFKVCIVDGIEVSTYRKGGCFGDSPDHPVIESAGSIHEDLARRDLTINAMAFCPYTGEIVDDHGGMTDLLNRIIRFTGDPEDRIREDPCRIIRACRFKAKIEGDFEERTLQSLIRNAHLVKKMVAPERIRLELVKVMGYPKPGIFFDALHGIDVLKDILPGFSACYGVDGGHYHAETIDAHLKLTGDFLNPQKPLLRLAGYLHDYGKPAVATSKNGKWSFIGHEITGAEMVEKELKALKFSMKEVEYVKALILLHMRNITEKDTPRSVRKILKLLIDSDISWKDWLQLKLADVEGNLKKGAVSRDQIKHVVMKIYHELYPEKGRSVLSIKDLAINGEDVMRELKIRPGPKVGEALERTLRYVMDEPERNSRKDLLFFIRNFK